MDGRRDGGEPAQRAAGRLVSRTRRLPDASLAAAAAVFPDLQAAWAAPGEPDVAGFGVAAEVVADGPGRFDDVRAEAAAVFDRVERSGDAPRAARPRLLGGFAFHEDHQPAPPWRGFPGARFVLPRVQVVWADDGAWVTVNDYGSDASPAAVEDELAAVEDAMASASFEPGPSPGYVETERTTTRAAWRAQVSAALDRIDAGDLEKVVLAQSLSVDLGGPFSLPDALARLGDRYPDCFTFAFDPGDGGAFFGATPERLVSVADAHVETAALAGSIERGETPAADEALADDLRASAKDAHEHAVVVEAIRDQLDPVAADVRTGGRAVRRLPSVQHLRTPVSADLDVPMHVLSLVRALHPTPAVGGLPPDAAKRTIRETETFDRGWYASPVGWFDADGDGSFAVGIRSAVADDDAARLFAGAGIVADSDPDAEWDEVQLKYRPMLDLLA
jgi:menaquinone-specific isochorismate synthase